MHKYDLTTTAIVDSLEEWFELSISEVRPFKIRGEDDPDRAQMIEGIISLSNCFCRVRKRDNGVEIKLVGQNSDVRSSLFVHQARKGNGESLVPLEHICTGCRE